MTHNDNSRLDDDATQIMSRVTGSDDDTIVMSPFVAQVMEASIRQTQGVTNSLIDGLTYQEAELRARLELVCERVAEIANRPYVANSYLYIEALHPRREDVEERMFRNGYTKG